MAIQSHRTGAYLVRCRGWPHRSRNRQPRQADGGRI